MRQIRAVTQVPGPPLQFTLPTDGRKHTIRLEKQEETQKRTCPQLRRAILKARRRSFFLLFLLTRLLVLESRRPWRWGSPKRMLLVRRAKYGDFSSRRFETDRMCRHRLRRLTEQPIRLITYTSTLIMPRQHPIRRDLILYRW